MLVNKVLSVSYGEEAKDQELETETITVNENTNTIQNEYKTVTCCHCPCCRCCIAVNKIISIALFYLLDLIILLLLFLYSLLFRVPYCLIAKCCCYSCCSNEPPATQRILIIGYSFAGLEIHQLLQRDTSLKHFQFTIIEPKSYIEFTPSILGCIAHPNRYQSISFPINKCFDPKRSQFIQAKAISLTSNTVSIEMVHDKSSKTIDFDYCFICSGSKYTSPIKGNLNSSDEMLFDNRQKQLIDVHKTLTDAGSVCIIGGGPVGVELMGEIVEQFPKKSVTVIDRNASLCRSFPESTKQYLKQWVDKHDNITLKLNTRISKIVNPDENREVETEKYWLYLEDKEAKQQEEDLLQFDMLFKCRGFEPNSELWTGEDGDKDKYNSLLVDDWLRVRGQHNIFALGDVMKLEKIHEVKLAVTAEWNALYLSAFMQHVNKNANSEFQPYHEWLFGDKSMKDGKPYEMPMIFTINLGSWDGAMGYFDVLSTGCCSPIMKWFIEWTFCKCWKRAPLFRIEYHDYTIFEMHPIGHTISALLWQLMHAINHAKL
eukprot:256385_1